MTKDKQRYALGIDFGGTNVKLGMVDERGVIVHQSSFRTEEAASQTDWLDAVARETGPLRDMLDSAGELVGVGIGVPGFVDYERGFVYELPNVPGWKDVQMGPTMRGRLGLPAFVDNDVNAMAVGECTFGSGRLFEHAVFLTLGTGVGGALLMNNKLYRGAYSMAGEMGHMSIDMNGIEMPFGRGGLEEYIGNQQISDRTVKELESGRPSQILDRVNGDLSAVSPRVIAECAAEGDELALEIFDFFAQCLATALASVTYLIQPQAFIIGGGVAQSGDVLFDPLRRHLNQRLKPVFAERVEIRPAELGNDAGMIGAATLALMSA